MINDWLKNKKQKDLTLTTKVIAVLFVVIVVVVVARDHKTFVLNLQTFIAMF